MDVIAQARVIGIAAALLATAGSGRAEQPFAGPIRATPVSIHDGDTFLADAHVWPGQVIRVNIRIRGIDAPEMRARCAFEKRAAHKSRDALARLIGRGDVTISNIAGAKYYGRVLADVAVEQGSVAALLLDRGLVRPYDGGRRQPFC